MCPDEAGCEKVEDFDAGRPDGELPSLARCLRLARRFDPDVDYLAVLRALLRRLDRRGLEASEAATDSSPACEHHQTPAD